jgi:hypothetical protein
MLQHTWRQTAEVHYDVISLCRPHQHLLNRPKTRREEAALVADNVERDDAGSDNFVAWGGLRGAAVHGAALF